MRRTTRTIIAVIVVFSMLLAMSGASLAALPTVTAVQSISNIIVSYGTSLTTVRSKLPSSVQVTLNNGSKKQSTNLIWDLGTPIYNKNIYGTYTFSSSLTVVGAIVPSTFRTVNAIVIVAKDVSSVGSINSITVPYGTSLATAKTKLPETVSVTFSNGSKQQVAVAWQDPPGYNGNAAGAQYTFNGILQLPAEILNSKRLQAKAVVIIGPKQVSSVSATSPISVLYGTTLDAVRTQLPKTVGITLNDGSSQQVSVTWQNPIGYDGNVIGARYTFNGTLQLSSDIQNPGKLQPSVVVTIVAREITSVSAINQLAVSYGTSFATVKTLLPAAVKAALSDGISQDIPLVWQDLTNYDGTVIGEQYTLNGTLQLPSGILNPKNLQANIDILITNGNEDPNSATKLNTSAGSTLFEFDSAEDWKASTSAAIEMDATNYVSGSASARLSASNPIAVDGTNTTYFSAQVAQLVYDKLTGMENVEFNLFVPDKSQIDYVLVNFYTDSSHNYFFQNAIGIWELSPGWNKIRRPLSDFYFVNSIPSTTTDTSSSSTEATSVGVTTLKATSIASSTMNKAADLSAASSSLARNGMFDVAALETALELKVDNFNKMLGKRNTEKLNQVRQANNAKNSALTTNAAVAEADTAAIADVGNTWNVSTSKIAAEDTSTDTAVTAATSVPSSWSSIDNMEIFVASKAGSTPTLNIDKVAFNVSGRTKVLFTFDDAWYDVLQYAEPVLSAKGFKATTWTNKTDSVEADSISTKGPLDVMSEADLALLYSKGWDIGNHTANHVDNVTQQTEDQMREEYLTNQDWLLANGWDRAAYHACYPSGSYNASLIQILKGIGVKSARVTEYGIQPTPVNNIYKLKTVFISRDTSAADITTQIDKAVATGSSLFFMLHRVEDSPIYSNESEYNALAVSTEKFSQIVDYVNNLVNQGKIDVDTISEWYAEYTAP